MVPRENNDAELQFAYGQWLWKAASLKHSPVLTFRLVQTHLNLILLLQFFPEGQLWGSSGKV